MCSLSSFKNDSNLSNKENRFAICEHANSNMIEGLKAKISELERALKDQQQQFDERSKLIHLVWGDNFNSDSLH